MESEMADSLVALHKHLSGANSRRFSTSSRRPQDALPAPSPIASDVPDALDRSRMVALLTA